jgi:hypothetical protein
VFKYSARSGERQARRQQPARPRRFRAPAPARGSE